MSARVLVTGARGFVGRACIAALAARGHRVVGTTSRRTDADDALPWPLEAVDLTDPRACRDLIDRIRPDALVHLAWLTTPGVFWSAPENLRWLAGGVALFDAFGARGGRRLVGVGSCAEYQVGEPLFHEDDTPTKPATVYGCAKASLALALAGASLAFGFSAAWARIFAPYGPGEPREKLISATAATLLEGGRAAVSDGTQVRDFMYVTDVADALVATLESEVEGPVNIGSGEAARLRDVIDRIGQLCGASDRIDFGARPRPVHDPDNLVADTTRLREEVGFAPRIGLDEGLRRAVDACRLELAGPRDASGLDTLRKS